MCRVLMRRWGKHHRERRKAHPSHKQQETAEIGCPNCAVTGCARNSAEYPQPCTGDSRMRTNPATPSKQPVHRSQTIPRITTLPKNTDTPQGSQDGTGEKPASGSNGNTVGSFGVEGFGARGWIRSPRATAPAGTNEEGQVILSFKVLPNGAVTGVRPIKTASSRLTQLAMSALRGAAARPLPPNAEQVTINCRITYTFKLQ